MSELFSSPRFAARGGWWVVAQAILMLTAVMLAVMDPGRFSNPPISALGFALFVMGGYFGIESVLVLGKNRTPYPQPREGSQLIRHGIYARVRHPLYTSIMLAAFGWALIWQSVASFGAALILIPFFRAKARREERWLKQCFPRYADYTRRVPGFLPRIGGKVNLVCNF